MSEPEYKKKADLWPLNPDGELINWTIVESKEGLAHVREIAAVKGIGVLWPGAGTLRGVFSTHRRRRRARRRHRRMGSGDPAGARRVQGVQRAVRLSGERERHRDAHEAGLQRLRHELGRRRLQRRRHRPQSVGPVKRAVIGTTVGHYRIIEHARRAAVWASSTAPRTRASAARSR